MIEILPNWHPVFVHFSVALLSVSVGLHLLDRVLPDGTLRRELAVTANWSLWLGALFAAITVVAGWFAYNSVTHDEPSHAAMTVHRNWGLATLAAFLALALWSGWMRRRATMPVRPGIIFLLLLVAGGVLLAGTAWRGGELVYRHGLGVLSSPVTEAQTDGHDHQHAPASGTGSGGDAMPAVVGHDNHNHAH